jgi:hypothetical protein
MHHHSSHNARSVRLIIALTAFLLAAPSVQLVAGTNKSVPDIQLHLIFLDVHGRLDANEPISYELRASLTNTAEFIFLPEDRYFCRAELVDSNGIVIPKTKIGKQFGSLFDNLEANPKYLRDRGPLNVFLNATNEVTTRRLKWLNHEAIGPILLRPVDLFDMTNAGQYKMKLDFQFLEWTTNTAPHVIQLPVVEVTVIKR